MSRPIHLSWGTPHVDAITGATWWPTACGLSPISHPRTSARLAEVTCSECQRRAARNAP